jgi:hypothetical protein
MNRYELDVLWWSPYLVYSKLVGGRNGFRLSSRYQKKGAFPAHYFTAYAAMMAVLSSTD